MLEAKGRHDPCVLPRAVPLVEAMCALVLADATLMQRARAPVHTLAELPPPPCDTTPTQAAPKRQKTAEEE